MTKIVGIRFHKAGKIYYFDPADLELETAMHVIVETARGVEMGTVLIPPKSVEDDKVIQPLKPVLRVASDEDEKVIEVNKEKEKEAFAICKEKIIKHGLEMKLVNAEYTFDGNKLLFYFTAYLPLFPPQFYFLPVREKWTHDFLKGRDIYEIILT